MYDGGAVLTETLRGGKQAGALRVKIIKQYLPLNVFNKLVVINGLMFLAVLLSFSSIFYSSGGDDASVAQLKGIGSFMAGSGKWLVMIGVTVLFLTLQYLILRFLTRSFFVARKAVLRDDIASLINLSQGRDNTGLEIVWEKIVHLTDVVKEKDAQIAFYKKYVAEEVKSQTDELDSVNRELNKKIEALKKMNKTIHVSQENKMVAAKSAQIKSLFLENMSHELRTPMNGILGMLSLLKETALNEEQLQMIGEAVNCSSSLLQLLEELLDKSKLDGGEIVLDAVEFDLSKVIDEVVYSFANPCYQKNIELVAYDLSNMPVLVKGDVARFRQVLKNLLANALKFTDHGFICLNYQVLEEMDEQILFQFDVEDSGIGVPDDAQEMIFELFSQVDGSRTRAYGGAGLGLALCKQICDLMGGSIGVDAGKGNGSRFWVKLPFEKVNIDFRDNSEKLMLGKNALLLEKSNANIKACQRYLNKLGCNHVSLFQQKKDLLEFLNRAESVSDISLVLLDLSTAGQNLDELYRLFFKNGFRGKLCVMGWQEQCQRLKSLQGYSSLGVINKPICFAQLVDLIEGKETRREQSSKITKLQDYSTSKYKVLVVEDNIVNQKVAVKRLQSLGFFADVVDNGRLALDSLAAESYDLILMDCQMPVLDGYETTKQIRQNECGTSKHIPIIAVTANALNGDREKCLDAGMDDYMSKPFKKEKLESVLSHWLPK